MGSLVDVWNAGCALKIIGAYGYLGHGACDLPLRLGFDAHCKDEDHWSTSGG